MAGEVNMIGELHRLVRGIRRGKTGRARSSAEGTLKIQPEKEDRAIAPSVNVVPESPITQKEQARPILDIPDTITEAPPDHSLDVSVEYAPDIPETVVEALPDQEAPPGQSLDVSVEYAPDIPGKALAEPLPDEPADISAAETSTREVETESPAADAEEDEKMEEEEVEESEERIVSEPEQLSPVIQTDTLPQSVEESASQPVLQTPAEEPSVTAENMQNVSSKGRPRKKKIIQREETFNEEEYEESKVVRIFNVDHGRKPSVRELTDRDVVLSTIESVALDASTEIDRESRKAVREFFIEIRKAFCESVNFQKEAKSMKTACSKVQSRIRRQRDQLLQIRQERARVRSELSKLLEECKVVQSRHENTKNLGQFLSDLSNLQQQMLQSYPTPAKQKKTSEGPVDLQGQLFVSRTILGTRDHIKNINGHIQQWLDEH